MIDTDTLRKTGKTINVKAPSWAQILEWIKIGHLDNNPDIFIPALNIADMIKDAKDGGAKSITFTFSEDGEIDVSTEEK